MVAYRDYHMTVMYCPSCSFFQKGFIEHLLHSQHCLGGIEFIETQRKLKSQALGSGHSVVLPGFLISCQTKEAQSIDFYFLLETLVRVSIIVMNHCVQN